MTSKMRAVTQRKYGSPDVLEVVDLDRPTPEAGSVLVRVEAASVNPLDWHMMRGAPYVARLQNGIRRPKRTTFGTDVAGVIVSVGAEVATWKVGDEVFGTAIGSCAEFALSRQNSLATKPPGVGFQVAAATPIAAVTALQALRDKGEVARGQRVLVNGAGGGVGTFAVQIAKALGSDVTGVCSEGKVDMVRSIGADRVIDYTTDDFTIGDLRYDVIIDTVGNRQFSDLRRVLTPTGRYVVVGGPDNGRVLGPLNHLIKAKLAFAFAPQKALPILAGVNMKDLELLGQMLADGRVKPVIDRTCNLVETADAVRYVEAGHASGKVVVVVNG